MRTVRIAATAVIVFLVSSLYLVYSNLSRLFLPRQRISGAGGFVRGAFRQGFAGASGSLTNISTWANGIELLALGLLILILVFRPMQTYPRWMQRIVTLGAVLLAVQVVLLFIHPAAFGGGNFRHFSSGGQFGQSGGSFPSSGGNSGLPSSSGSGA